MFHHVYMEQHHQTYSDKSITATHMYGSLLSVHMSICYGNTTHISACRSIHMSMHMSTHHCHVTKSLYTCLCTRLYTCLYTCLCTYLHACPYTCLHIFLCTPQQHIQAHVCTHVYTCPVHISIDVSTKRNVHTTIHSGGRATAVPVARS